MDFYKIMLYIISYVMSAMVIVKITKDYTNEHPDEDSDILYFAYMLASVPILNMWVALVFLFEELKEAYNYKKENDDV